MHIFTMTYNKYIFIYINLRFVGGGSRHFVLSHDLARKLIGIENHRDVTSA